MHKRIATIIGSSDLWALAALAIAIVILRARSVDCLSVNPDENQYEAHAAYLVGSGKSTFSTPIGPVHANGLFKLFAQGFGIYCLPQVRMVVMLICFAMAATLYLIARQLVRAPFALTAALLFAVYANYFEGLSANREWFVDLLVLTGLLIYLVSSRGGRRRGWAGIAAAGLLCGMAVWIKDQAIVLTVPVAVDLAYEAVLQRCWSRGLAKLAFYGAGIMAAVALYWIPFVIAGTAVEHWRFLVDMRLVYAGHRTSPSLGQTGLHLADNAYLQLPFHGLWLLAYLQSAVAIVALVGEAMGSRRVPSVDRRVRLTVFYFLASMGSVCLGSRFFPHYFLLALPAFSLLTAFGLSALCDYPQRMRSVAVGATMLAAWLAGWAWKAARPTDAVAAGEAFWSCLTGFVAVLAILAWLRWRRPAMREQRPAWRSAISLAAGVWYVVQIALLATDTVEHWKSPLYWEVTGVEDVPYRELRGYFQRHANPHDRLFVWGWRPEIYSMVGLEAATQFATGMEVMRDIDQDSIRPPRYEPGYAKRLMTDLAQRRPRFIVDAWVHSIHGAWYRLDFFPPLASLLAADYTRVATINDCDIYERRPDGTPERTMAIVDDAREESLIRDAVRRWPEEATLLVNWGDFLAQQGRPHEARQVYEQLRRRSPGWRLPRERLDALARGQRSAARASPRG